jgi:UDP-N-acetylglucosamine:LPS N-acetylglucosamine transferase
MKIALVCSAGGHLAQIEKIFTKEVIGENETLLITERNPQTTKIKGAILFNYLKLNPLKNFVALIKLIKIFRKEKIKMVITTGADLGVMAMIAGKILGLKTVFIETIIRVKTPTLTGRIAYYFSDVFLVQHDGMGKLIGKRAIYRGGIL